MKSADFFTIVSTLSLTLALGGQALAQSEEAEEELEIITFDNPYFEDDAVDEQDDLIFDQESQSYRLVEDTEEDVWIEPPSELEQNEAELRRLFELYRDSLAARAYLEADTLAKQIVELSIRIYGLDSHDSAKALTNLGIAQHNNEEYEAALQNFTASIGIVERIDDRLSAALINPLRGLAATQAAMGRADLARDSFQRAVHVSHVNDGPHNLQQVKTLESMAELYISVGEYDEAMDLQENIFSIQARKLDPDSIEIVPALEKQAYWRHRLRMYHKERLSWRRIIQLIEKDQGKMSLQLIPPLSALGKSYLFVTPADFEFQSDTSVASGETYLRRANRIARENPDADWKINEKTLLALGDYYILSGRPNRAARLYEETWTLLSQEDDPERLQYRRTHLENLNALQEVYPPKYYNSEREDNGQEPSESFQTGTISLSYTVNPTGRISKIMHLETQPPEIVDFASPVARSMRHLMYRPQMKDGQTIATQDIVFTHEFFYRPEDIPAAVAEDSAEEGE